MDIKWKSIKKTEKKSKAEERPKKSGTGRVRCVLAYIAFIGSISLLIGAVLPGMVRVFSQEKESDYRLTAEGKQYITKYLNRCLYMVTGDYYTGEYFGEFYDEAYEEYYGNVTSWQDGILLETDAWEVAQDFEITAAELHARMKEDKNILYAVRKDGELLYTNAEGFAAGKLPVEEGYHFYLKLEDGRVEITNYGEKLDVYGDGYYNEEDGDWLVPGYQNYPAPENLQGVSVSLAVIDKPGVNVIITEEGREVNSGGLCFIARKVERREQRVLVLANLSGLMLLLFAGWFFLRRDKRRADEKAARLLKKLHVEFKLAVLVLTAVIALYRLLFGPDSYGLLHLLPELLISGYSFSEYGYDLDYLMRELFSGLTGCLPLFWALYFFALDVRRNGKFFQNSLCVSIYKICRGKELSLPLQKRLVKRSAQVAADFAATLFMVVFSIFYAFALEGSRFKCLVFFIAAFLAAAVSLIHAVLYLRDNRRLAGDMELLLQHITAVREGRLEEGFTLPEDSDLAAAAVELSEIEQGLEEALTERIRSERMKVELVSNVSHDIKTPLTSIISYVELLKQEEDLPVHVQEYIAILDSKARRLSEMVKDVFEVSKAASGQLPVKWERLDLGKLLRQTLADMGERIQQSGFVVRGEIPEERVAIMADGQRLYRVFQNLLQNALQYSLQGSRIYVTLRQEGEEAVASVKNTSATELRADIDFTERFQRGDESRTDGGSGLGLSIARSFTEACGGSLQVEVIADLFVVTVRFQQDTAGESKDHIMNCDMAE